MRFFILSIVFLLCIVSHLPSQSVDIYIQKEAIKKVFVDTIDFGFTFRGSISEKIIRIRNEDNSSQASINLDVDSLKSKGVFFIIGKDTLSEISLVLEKESVKEITVLYKSPYDSIAMPIETVWNIKVDTFEYRDTLLFRIKNNINENFIFSLSTDSIWEINHKQESRHKSLKIITPKSFDHSLISLSYNETIKGIGTIEHEKEIIGDTINFMLTFNAYEEFTSKDSLNRKLNENITFFLNNKHRVPKPLKINLNLKNSNSMIDWNFGSTLFAGIVLGVFIFYLPIIRNFLDRRFKYNDKPKFREAVQWTISFLNEGLPNGNDYNNRFSDLKKDNLNRELTILHDKLTGRNNPEMLKRILNNQTIPDGASKYLPNYVFKSLEDWVSDIEKQDNNVPTPSNESIDNFAENLKTYCKKLNKEGGESYDNIELLESTWLDIKGTVNAEFKRIIESTGDNGAVPESEFLNKGSRDSLEELYINVIDNGDSYAKESYEYSRIFDIVSNGFEPTTSYERKIKDENLLKLYKYIKSSRSVIKTSTNKNFKNDDFINELLLKINDNTEKGQNNFKFLFHNLTDLKQEHTNLKFNKDTIRELKNLIDAITKKSLLILESKLSENGIKITLNSSKKFDKLITYIESLNNEIDSTRKKLEKLQIDLDKKEDPSGYINKEREEFIKEIKTEIKTYVHNKYANFINKFLGEGIVDESIEIKLRNNTLKLNTSNLISESVIKEYNDYLNVSKSDKLNEVISILRDNKIEKEDKVERLRKVFETKSSISKEIIVKQILNAHWEEMEELYQKNSKLIIKGTDLDKKIKSFNEINERLIKELEPFKIPEPKSTIGEITKEEITINDQKSKEDNFKLLNDVKSLAKFKSSIVSFINENNIIDTQINTKYTNAKILDILNTKINPPEAIQYPGFTKKFSILINNLNVSLDGISEDVLPNSPFIKIIDRIKVGISGDRGLLRVSKGFSINLDETIIINNYDRVLRKKAGIEKDDERQNLKKIDFYNYLIKPYFNDVINQICRLYLYSQVTKVQQDFENEGIDLSKLNAIHKEIKDFLQDEMDLKLIEPRLFKSIYNQLNHEKSEQIPFINGVDNRRYYPIFSELKSEVIFDIESVGLFGLAGTVSRKAVVFVK